jgi:serine/threonine protein kinase
MTLSPGTRLGPYEIITSIGAGGMGEVFRARDTKLNRDVAIKVLPAAFADDPERLARFTREAQTLASLNHPNIATIHGIEEVPAVSGSTGPGSRALVMELVEGEDLSAHIARGAIPIAEALPIARQIAEALEAAHEQGIVHRDLKPANIKVRSDGTVKVLDFGLAKAMDGGGAGNSQMSQSPTMSRHMTEAGMIIGTAAYMSPEQAKGKTVDKRTDIWAFGVVLYEMISGKRAFKGEGVSETLASVLKDKLAMDELPAATPPRLKRLIERCLNRDLKTRLRDIGEARIEIVGIETGGPDGAVSTAPTADAASATRSRLPWALVAALAIALAVALLGWAPWRAVPVPFETRLDITTPPTDDPASFAISPDGRRLVFVATEPDGKSQLWLRPLDQREPKVLPGTEGASSPFWSPDSRSVAFSASGKLKRLDIGAGVPQTVAQWVGPRGGSWSPEGVILLGLISGPLVRVPITGGTTTEATKLAPEENSHRFPHFLPGGRRFLFYKRGIEAGLYLGSLDSTDSKRIGSADSGAQFVAPGSLLFLRQGALMAQHLDLERGELTGEAVSVADQVAFDATLSKGAFSVSPEGPIAYRSGGFVSSQLTWFDRLGKVAGTIGSPDASGLSQPMLSPDGRRAAAYRTVQGNPDLWLFEAGRETRLTFDAGRDQFPAWSPDGSRIAFSKDLKGQLSLYQKSSLGGSAEELLLAASGKDLVPQAFSPDGRFLMYIERAAATLSDLWVLPLDLKTAPSVFANSNFDERSAQFSPDGKWVAYTSDESGQSEVYLRPFPASSGQYQVSTSGGITPRWRHDGKELYYIAPDSKLMAVTLATAGRTPEMGVPIALFQPNILNRGAVIIGYQAQYDVAPDGRFLINVTGGDAVTAPITVIQNWAPKK